ncbi:similar to DRE1 protein (predicted), isoform CRA_b [Rattus norvegicus]|uniref:Similar to DRE1 protein (Predicted), isoform CRA_b n=1 Tax=Rattus norvegicus TaxID=10116 RepID=A6I6H5_RAT|nr:similar to DRE1 protein (predicted), isoform CRA_b [Rattus norvegicus]
MPTSWSSRPTRWRRCWPTPRCAWRARRRCSRRPCAGCATTRRPAAGSFVASWSTCACRCWRPPTSWRRWRRMSCCRPAATAAHCCLRPVPASSWAPRQARCGPGRGGGHINSRDVWMFNSHLNTWIKVASMHKGRWRHKMVALQGQLFAVGGFDGLRRLRSVERYDPFSNTWAATAPLPEAVSSAAVAPCAGQLYVIGGAGQDGVNTDKVQCFDPKEDQWSLRSPAPFLQRCLEAVSLGDTIYVVGGLMSKIFTYDPGSDVWREAADLPSPVESCGVTVCDGKVHILGGRDEHGESTNSVFTFDPGSGQVEAQPSLQRCTSSHGCVTIVQSLSR